MHLRKDELNLLLYLETGATDFGGLFDCRRINSLHIGVNFLRKLGLWHMQKERTDVRDYLLKEHGRNLLSNPLNNLTERLINYEIEH